MAQQHDHNPLSHVVDHNTLEIPFVGELPLPNLGGFQLTRFMVMELLAAILLIAVFVPLARHVSSRPVTKGRLNNLFESFVMFIRNQVARPTIGEHDADRFLPYLLTIFFFILFCNLLGMIPGGAAATGNINVTGVLALVTLGVTLYAGMRERGPVAFLKGLVPPLDVPFILKPFLVTLMFIIEVAGLLIRHVVLAIRLFANMLAGHIILAVILGFILQVAGALFYVVMPASMVGAVAISMLELFVAFLQAYIFTFIAALSIGAAAHPHH